MQRFNGRRNLVEEIEVAKKNKENVVVTRANETSTTALWIKNLHFKNYLFKKIAENEKYRSLLVQKMAQYENIEFPKTDMAYYGYEDGELIEDYRKEGYIYCSGTMILREYYLFLVENQSIKEVIPNYHLYQNNEDYILKKLNNLEDIWNALDFHFRKFPNKTSIVANLMKNLANRFAFDFLTMQRDRFDGNWEIEEAIDHSSAHLTPLFDCNKSFQYSSFQIEMDPGSNMKVSDIYEKLTYYLTWSESNFTKYFYQLLETYTPEIVEKLLNEIETENNFHMESYSKIEIIGSYQMHYEEMLKIVKECKRGNYL